MIGVNLRLLVLGAAGDQMMHSSLNLAIFLPKVNSTEHTATIEFLTIYQKVPSINSNQVYIEKQELEKTRMGV